MSITTYPSASTVPSVESFVSCGGAVSSRGGKPSFARNLLVSSTDREISSPCCEGCDGFGAGLSTSKGGRPKLARSLLVSSTDMEISPFDSSTLNLDLKSCFSLGATREWECLGERDRLGEREL